MPKYYYHRSPTLNINPASPAAPKLGSIFSSLRRLTNPLNQDDYVSIPTHLTTSDTLLDFSETSNARVEISGGLSAEAAQGLLGSGELIYTFARDKGHVYRCARLETAEFDPDERFVDDCIKSSQRVQSFIADSFLGNQKVYMITGLKIATSFSMKTTTSSEHGPTLQVGFDATALGIPAQVGPQAGFVAGQHREVVHGPLLEDIVFAYRVVKVSPKRNGKFGLKNISGGQYSVADKEADKEEGWHVEGTELDDIERDFPDSAAMTIERGEGVI